MALRFGIVGCGMIGHIYGERLRALGHDIVAASDPKIERARAVAGSGRSYRDHRDMLAAGGLDIACICSPTPHHYETVMNCAAAGIGVFLEKPMAVTLTQGQEMRAAIMAAGLRIGFGFKMRFETLFATARKLISDGTIGKVRYSVFSFYQPMPPGERIWYTDVGVLRDMLVHMIDLATWLHSGEARSVRARTRREIGRAGEDKAFLDINFEEAGEARIQGGYIDGYAEVAGREDIAFQLIGEAGYLLGKRPDLLIRVTSSGTAVASVSPVDAFAAELAAFIEAFSAGMVLPVTDLDGLRAQAVIDAAERSADLDGAAVVVSALQDPARKGDQCAF